MSETNSRSFGGRYRAAEPADPPRQAEPAAAQQQATSKPQDSVLDFVIYLYNRIRNDATMVTHLDHALKERYHAFQ